MTRNDLNVETWPISGWIATITATSEPPAAASAEPSPKVIRWMRCTSMPQTWATSRLWDTARIALPSRVDRRNTKAPRVIAMAKPPTTKEPVRYSTERRSEVKASWARFTSAIETPKVSSSDESSGASTTRRTRKRCSATPTRKRSGIDTSRERYGLRLIYWKSQNVV